MYIDYILCVHNHLVTKEGEIHSSTILSVFKSTEEFPHALLKG